MYHPMMILEALTLLVRHDAFMRTRSFAELCARFRATPLRPLTNDDNCASMISTSVDIASAFYVKPVLCLQRSAVLCAMLRRRGVEAKFVVGVQQSPFKAHAWIEVNGSILSDPLAEQERFQVMEVC